MPAFCFVLVIGAIAVCLFPLWPESFRVYSWYLSVAAMICIGLILFLAICELSIRLQSLFHIDFNQHLVAPLSKKWS